MNARLDAYLSDLDEKLRPQIEDARRAEVIAELRFHLTMSARDAQKELEMELDEAARAALRSLGPVETVAEDLVRQHRGGTAQSEWKVARKQMLLYFLLCFLIPVLLNFLPERIVMQKSFHDLLLCLPTLFLVFFAVAVWRSRRWLLKAVSVTILACAALAIGFVLSSAQGILQPGQLAVRERWRQNRLEEIEQEIRMTHAGAEGYRRRDPLLRRDGKFYHPQGMVNRHHMPAPFLPFLMPYATSESIALVPGDWNPRNVDEWQRYGRDCRNYLLAERAELETAGPLLASRSSWLFFATVSPLLQIGMLGLVNFAVLAASNRRRRRQARRDIHLA